MLMSRKTLHGGRLASGPAGGWHRTIVLRCPQGTLNPLPPRGGRDGALHGKRTDETCTQQQHRLPSLPEKKGERKTRTRPGPDSSQCAMCARNISGEGMSRRITCHHRVGDGAVFSAGRDGPVLRGQTACLYTDLSCRLLVHVSVFWSPSSLSWAARWSLIRGREVDEIERTCG